MRVQRDGARPAGERYYAARIAEAGVATLTSGTFTAKFLRNAMSKGSQYCNQDTSDALNGEGILLRWALGSALSAASACALKATLV